ncbi:2,3-diphosphoglycerate-dependent phosphoglycerate mutase GpmB [Rothia nasimurium]|uniref:Histidine phosphatase family protein n=1 Tax=Luteibacter anthropi TaxID=564369 RepID=A0A7X5U6N6_9GAMM|nr:histidine phosphatase family protein [Luteibacter anthropi]NII04812.1 histidine phosphatase family protein [Luteibacter anthropi]
MLEQVILARHGETEWNVAGRAQGREDSPLTAAGLEQAEALGRRLASLGVGHIISSPLLRARRTAEIAALAIGGTVSLDERLVERSFGELEGRLVAEAMAENPRWIEVLRGTEPGAAARGGESLHDVAARMLPALEAARALPYRRVAVLSHGHCLRAVLGALGDGNTANYHHGNCAYTPLALREGRFTFDRWNLSALELADA